VATYAVGDIQGCYDQLRHLLDSVHFEPQRDELWAVGDLVNRGPNSSGVLRYLRSLGSAFRGILGNHDLHLLAVAAGTRSVRAGDTLDDVLQAPDRDELLSWLRSLPLAIFERGYLMVHAGVVPDWSVSDVLRHASSLQSVISGADAVAFYSHMYGNRPSRLAEAQQHWDRLRVITNVLTRIRFCSADGHLDLDAKGPPDQAPPGMRPWFEHEHRKTRRVPILFGHWAALSGRVSQPEIFALDTGCAWGRQLTALRLEDHKRFSCPCA
jgi:bis(5'-nucleosyl)-tetraphosphatase (symmetrical)